jgi:Domain of unknown function (DUF4062)
MKTSLAIFLCSTHDDLMEERAKVLEAVRKLRLEQVTMEFFGARADQPLETCLAEVRKSDLLIVIVAHLYGSIVPEMNISFTEAEYREAIRLGKPCLVYFKSEDAPVLPRFVEREPKRAKALARFKEHLHTNHTVGSFENSTELSDRIVDDLTRALDTFSESKKAEKELQRWVDKQQGENEHIKRIVSGSKYKIEEHWILRVLYSGPFYVAPSRAFLAYFDNDIEVGANLILLTTSDALRKGLSREDKRLVAGLVARMPNTGAAARAMKELEQERNASAWLEELKEAKDPLAEAVPYL